jgi:hypothetical protein
MRVPSCCTSKPSVALLSPAAHKILVPSSPLVQQDIHAHCSKHAVQKRYALQQLTKQPWTTSGAYPPPATATASGPNTRCATAKLHSCCQGKQPQPHRHIHTACPQALDSVHLLQKPHIHSPRLSKRTRQVTDLSKRTRQATYQASAPTKCFFSFRDLINHLRN